MTKSENRNSKLVGGLARRNPSFAFRISSFASVFWHWLREVFEDSAYDRYVTRAEKARVTPSGACPERSRRVEGSAFVSPSTFYRLRVEHKYSRPSRCC